MTMATIETTLQPFRTPNFVLVEPAPKPRQEGWQEPPKYHLRELKAEALSDLCDQFRRDVFKKAGVQDPRPPERENEDGDE